MTKIITDTAADITLAQAQAMDITIVPLGIFFGDIAYHQLQDEKFDLFYKMLETNEALPVTSQPSPESFLSEFLSAKEQGEDVVVITISGILSGTIQSATVAKEISEYENIYIIDSKQAAIGERLLVEWAVRLRGEGKTAREIAQVLNQMIPRITLFGTLDTLKYLQKGGRIPKSTALIGSVIGIKPMITLVDGAIVPVGKARGHAGARTAMLRLMQESVEIDHTCPVYFGYSDSDTNCARFHALAAENMDIGAAQLYPIGGTIGTHVGPGVSAVVFLRKE